MFPVECINRRINSDCSRKQREPVALCNLEVLCFLCDRILICTCYTDELRLQRDRLMLIRNITENIEHHIKATFKYCNQTWVSKERNEDKMETEHMRFL
jgi:hypothetical protein